MNIKGNGNAKCIALPFDLTVIKNVEYSYFYEFLIVNVTMNLVGYYVNLLMCGFLRFVFMNTKRFFQTVFLKAKQLRANLKVQVK